MASVAHKDKDLVASTTKRNGRAALFLLEAPAEEQPINEGEQSQLVVQHQVVTRFLEAARNVAHLNSARHTCYVWCTPVCCCGVCVCVCVSVLVVG